MFDRQNDRSHVAFDIETTGFGYKESVTAVGFWYPDGHAALVLNVSDLDDVDQDELTKVVSEKSGGVDVSVLLGETNQGVLREVREQMYAAFDRDYNRLVAFNAETWKGGFDLPFLRSLCIKCNVPWVFDGIQFADLYDPLSKRVNTTVTDHDTSAEANTLTGSHELLAPTKQVREMLGEHVPEDHPWYVEREYDPFGTSADAVRAYRNKQYHEVLLHNLADIHRTWELGELLRTYAPPKDISTKKL